MIKIKIQNIKEEKEKELQYIILSNKKREEIPYPNEEILLTLNKEIHETYLHEKIHENFYSLFRIKSRIVIICFIFNDYYHLNGFCVSFHERRTFGYYLAQFLHFLFDFICNFAPIENLKSLWDNLHCAQYSEFDLKQGIPRECLIGKAYLMTKYNHGEDFEVYHIIDKIISKEEG